MKEAVAISPGIVNPLLTVTEVINSYSKKLLGFIRRRVHTDADAEDILHDVFYQFIGNTKPIEQLSGWLFTVARNKITDRKRKKKPEALESILRAEQSENRFDWQEIFKGNADTPETSYLRNLFWEELTIALQQLPREQRDAFIHHELEGRSFKSMSKETGETVNTLLSRKRYAVLHLRERLRILRDELLNF